MTAFEKVEVLRRASLRRSLPPLPPSAPRPEQTPEPSAEAGRSSPVAEHARIEPHKGAAPVHSAPAPTKAKSTRLLMAGLKSGEVGKIIDKMEAEDASNNPEDGQTKRLVEESSRSLPAAEPARIDADPAAVARDQTAGTPGAPPNQSKAKGARLLMAGLKSGEVGKIVDKMEDGSANPEDSHTKKAAEESSRPPEVAEPARIDSDRAVASEPPAGAQPNQSKVKGAKLLMAGLKSGEVGKIVDKMEAEEESSRPPEVAEPARIEPAVTSQSAPPAVASEPVAGKQSKVKGAKLLMAGLKSGEVGKIVDKMEAGEESSRPPEVAEPTRTEPDRGPPPVQSAPPAAAPPAAASEPPGKQSKVKGAKLLMAGLKSGEVGKIVDKMEAEEESSRSVPSAEPARIDADSAVAAVQPDPPVVATEPQAGLDPKESKVKGARLLMAGLKSGEVGKIVDKMEAQDAPKEPAGGQAAGAAEATSRSAPAAEAPRIDPIASGGAAPEPPVGASDPPAGAPPPNPTKLKGAKLLMAGLKSGEVGKIVDKMEEEAAKEDGQTKDEAEDDPLFEF